MIRRVSIFAGPGAGKSTLSHKIVAQLKIEGYDVEHVAEYVKQMAYEGRMPQGNDQLYIFSKQLKYEERALRHVNNIVTDSPVMLSPAYATLYGYKSVKNLIGIARDFDVEYPALNIFLERTVRYVQKGRYQAEDEAKKFDDFLKGFLKEHLSSPLHFMKVEEFDQIMDLIHLALGEPTQGKDSQ